MKFNNLISDMERFAKKENVPIMQKEGLEFLISFIKEHDVKSVLEVGTAIGYSTILIKEAVNNITSIERDEKRYLERVKNIKECGLDKKINVALQDALELNIPVEAKYDLIFIDAAKGQYTRFFEKYQYFLKDTGVIITDNLKFHGYVGKSDTIESKNLRQLVSKIESYIDFLKNNADFETTFYDIGDGLSVSKKRNHE